MRFGNCPNCNEYKYLDSEYGLCRTCLDDSDEELIELLERASTTPEEIIENIKSED